MWIAIIGAILLIVCALWYYIWKDADPARLPEGLFPWHVPRSHDDINKSVPTENQICVIGAGFCGLGIAAAFKRWGIPFTSYERANEIGGNWQHGVYETVHIISSRITTEYKDWRMPTNYPDFPSAEQVVTYLHNYASHFNLRPHIHLNTEVKSVTPLGKGKESKGWEVELGDGTKHVYKGVVVANGHHWAKRFPTYPGMDKFEGESIHSKDYKAPNQLRGKRVLVVGGGNSACDIAVEAARYGAASHVSHRRGYWFLPRTLMGVPLVDGIRPWMPVWLQRIVAWTIFRVTVGWNSSYKLEEPDHAIFEHHPTINSELLHFIKLGKITPHPDIVKIQGNSVYFKDGTNAEFDMIVYATGYHIKLPMLSDDVVPFEQGIPQLIGGLTALNYKNLYIFGFGQVRYGAGSLISLGADTLARMIKIQDKLNNPLSNVLKATGAGKMPKKDPKCADVLQDPHKMCLEIKIANWFIPKLPAVEKWLQRFNRLS